MSKLLLPSAPPVLLAALLYLGAGLGMAAISLVRRALRASREDVRLRRTDLPFVLGIVVTGGVLGPVLMLMGLRLVSGIVGSLLLNLEGPLTAVLAVLLFGDRLTGREGMAAALIFAGAAVVTWTPGASARPWLGGVMIAAACLSWAIDNNLTQRLSVRDPIALVRVKTLSAGSCNLALALALGQRVAAPSLLFPVALIGFLCYGVSILLDVYALRFLGAAREAAFFATAPFMGVLVAVPLLGERLRWSDTVAATAMIIGVAVLVRGRTSSAT